MNWNKQNPYLAKITSKKLLSGKQSNKEVYHYEISLGDSGIIYQPGDSLGIFPVNNNILVRAVLNRLQINPTYIPEGYDLNIYELLQKKFERHWSAITIIISVGPVLPLSSNIRQ